MKMFIYTLSFAFAFQFSFAQSAILDKEKLLEFYQTQRYADAALYLQSIYPSDTKDVKALSQMAYCNMMAGKLPEAEKSYLKINEIQPNTLPVLFNLANINTRRGNDLKAKGYLESIVKIDTTNFNAFKQLAGLIKDSLQLKITYLKKANSLNPADADVATDLAQGYRDLQKWALGYQVLKVAIAADTSNLFLLQAQLPFANELKKYKEVIYVGEKLLKDGADANVVKDVGKAYYFLKNYEKCISYYQMLEKVDKQTEMTLYMMTLSYRELKNLEMAATYAKRTIEEGISPNTSTYYSLLAALQESNGKLTAAVASYKRSLTFNENGNTYYRLGLLYDLKLKQLKNASIYYNLYLASKPDTKVEKGQIDYVTSRLADLKSLTK
ncbi:tetratricopeptide repeat protein [Pedobacter sp. UC225_61]|uniref:tetratricopeptide repeat protein n=1 Tax=Pedobacter sp. UC225_61 TaxID=3374623 RepID=UPI0037B8F8D7